MRRRPQRRKHQCCPWIIQTWIALVGLVCAIFFMAMLQLYPDSLPDYPEECHPLVDVGFAVIPQLTGSYTVTADILVLVAIVSFLVITPFFLATPQLVIRRWLVLLAALYLLRGFTVAITRYPRLPFKLGNYKPANPILGALSIMVGAKQTATDIMYSGHTVNFTLAASFVSRYTFYGAFSFLFWTLCIVGMLALIGTREHYSADIVVAFVITKLAFWAYHLFFDSLYRRFWAGGLEIQIDDPEARYLAMPLTIVDGTGFKLKVTPDMVSDLALLEGHDLEHNGRPITLLQTDPFDGMRGQMYALLRWFDGE